MRTATVRFYNFVRTRGRLLRGAGPAILIFPEAYMQSQNVQNEQSPKDQSSLLNSHRTGSIKVGVDWAETGWFLEREKDELAGYLFAEDCEMRRGCE